MADGDAEALVTASTRTPSPTRLLVIGADAAGMSAAHQALRTAKANGRDLEVVAVESSGHTSYSACGIPYWMAGDVGSGDDLVARTAAEHRERGVDLRMRHEAIGLDLAAGTAEVRDHEGGRTVTLGFDEVLIATGAEPLLPDWARSDGAGSPPPDGVLAVKTLDDGAAWRRLLDDGPESALVVGGGYIGVEAAETFARRGVRTMLVTRGEQLMSSSLVPEMGAEVARGLRELGVDVVTGAEVGGIDSGAAGQVSVACVDGREFPADVVAVGVGVRPRVRLAVEAGLPVGAGGAGGALVPDDHQRVGDGVWAAGDCCAVHDLLLREPWFVPLGTHANKTGRVAGTNLGGGDARFHGSVGTAITRAGAVEVARTGLLPLWADRLGLETVSVRVESTTASGYMPEADPMSIWVLGERDSGRLLGCQITGGRGAAKRVDVVATALSAQMTAEDVAQLDLAYAPPFSPAWDPVQIACRKLATQL